MAKWEVSNEGKFGLALRMDGGAVADIPGDLGELAEDIARKLNAFDEMYLALKLAEQEIAHDVPESCYSTGPCTGDDIRDLIACPGCSALQMIVAAIALAEAR